MILVLLDVRVVAVATLEHHEEYKLFELFGFAYVSKRGLQRVVEDERMLPKHLEGGEVRVDAARHEHLMLCHVLQQILVKHVLAIVEHVVEHVHLKARAEELRDRIVV